MQNQGRIAQGYGSVIKAGAPVVTAGQTSSIH
jgi:hypothetical protein